MRSRNPASLSAGPPAVQRRAWPLLVPFETLLESADFHVEDAGLDDAFVIGADKGQVVGRQLEKDVAALARLEQDFRKALEAL